MNSRNYIVAAAVAAALGAAGSANAASFNITQYGSSAVAPVVEQIFKDYCSMGSLSEYRDATAQTVAGYNGGGSSYRIYTCTLGTKSAVPTSIQGATITYSERETGGSVYGVNPVALSQSTYGAMSFTNCASVAAGESGVAATYACFPVVTSGTVPDIGISDVEPALFTASANLPAGFTALSTAQLAALQSDPFLQQTFGVGLGSTISTKISNLTEAQIVGILSGNYTDWSEVNTSLTPGTYPINLCLRTNGSGTQAGALAIFLNNPCSAAGAVSLGSTLNASLAPSTGGLISCLDGSPDGIGILSLADGPKTTDNFALVSINGAAPSASNAATGSYKYAVESTVNYRTSGYNASQSAFINAFKTVFSDPASLSTVNAGLPAPAVNALEANYTPAVPYSSATPIEYGTRFGSTCSPYTLIYP
jgi:ABC-type phosphate transport system substrate-binding protein